MHRSQILLAIGSLVTMTQVGCQPEPAYQAPPPPNVTVVKPTIETVPIFLVENGETEAVAEAVVQARVRGILEEIHFVPNSRVKNDEKLFLIQQDEYDAALTSAKAAVSSSEAQQKAAEAAALVADAEIEKTVAAVKVYQQQYDRMDVLFNQNKAVSQREFDEATAQLNASKAAMNGATAARKAADAGVLVTKAQVERDKADLIEKQLEWNWTTVKAPISGRITKTMVKLGNLVDKGTPLVKIVENDPIWANFNINERFLLNLENHAKRGNEETLDLTSIEVQLQRSGDTGFPFKGHLDYADPKVDQDTGTLQLRAVFDNPPDGDLLLLPGLFVRVRIQIDQYENATLIPESAIVRDQAGAFVYVVGDGNKARRKNVTLGTQYKNLMVIENGLDSNDTVIVDGHQRVREGSEINPG